MAEQNKTEFMVTARKWRPLRFDTIAGQDHISSTLMNAIRLGRIHHAYLFSGPRGVGKTTTARIFARAVNCTNPQNFEPCNECESCRTIIEGRSLDVIEIDGASNNSVEDVRKLRDNAKYPPVVGNYKMYIIDEVHMLSNSAFNALLKILEEPPAHLLFVFATTESHKVPATILSRCQRFDFRRMEIETIVSQLKQISDKEGIKIDEESLITIARKGDGSMRDSQSIFDRVVAFCGKDVKYSETADALNLIDAEYYFRISDAILNKDYATLFYLVDEIIRRGYDLGEALEGLMEHYRNIATVCTIGNADLIEGSKSIKERYHAESKNFDKNSLLMIMNLLAETFQAMKYASQPRIRFELMLTQLASMDSAQDIAQLISEVKAVKNGTVLPQSAQPDPVKKKYDPVKIELPPTVKSIEENKRENVITTSPEVGDNVIATVPSQHNSQIHTAPNVEDQNTFTVDTETKAEADNSTVTELEQKRAELNWEDFLDFLVKNDVAFKTIANARAKFSDNVVTLTFSAGFIADNMRKKNHLLTDYALTFFNKNYKFEYVTDGNTGNTTHEQKNAVGINNLSTSAPSKTPNKKVPVNTEDLHPVEKYLIEEFGAEEVVKNSY